MWFCANHSVHVWLIDMLGTVPKEEPGKSIFLPSQSEEAKR